MILPYFLPAGSPAFMCPIKAEQIIAYNYNWVLDQRALKGWFQVKKKSL